MVVKIINVAVVMATKIVNREENLLSKLFFHSIS